MNVQPVSVIIPTYNRKQFLPRALESVLRQSARCAEIIIVDDGSTDNTEEYIRKMQLHVGEMIRYHRQENLGPAAARNAGIELSNYKYIAFLDSDDHWHKKKIEIQLKMMTDNPDYLISHTREKWLRRGVHLNQKKKHIPRGGYIFSHCLELCAVGMSTVMVKSDLFDKVGMFNESYRCCEDYEFWLRTSCRHEFLLVEDQLTIKEGGREDQVSQQYRIGMDKLRIRALEELINSDKLTRSQLCSAAAEMGRKATIYGNGCVRHGKEDEGNRFLALAEKSHTLTARNTIDEKEIMA